MFALPEEHNFEYFLWKVCARKDTCELFISWNVSILKVILYIHQLNAFYNYGDIWNYGTLTMKIRRCLYLLSICKCKMMKIIFLQSTFTGIGSSFLSVETKLKLFSFIQSLYCLCHNERWYRIWLLWKLETTSNKQLLTSSNDIKWYLFIFSRVSQVPFS